MIDAHDLADLVGGLLEPSLTDVTTGEERTAAVLAFAAERKLTAFQTATLLRCSVNEAIFSPVYTWEVT